MIFSEVCGYFAATATETEPQMEYCRSCLLLTLRNIIGNIIYIFFSRGKY